MEARKAHEPPERTLPDRFSSFDLSIERIGEIYRATVTSSPVGPRPAVEIDPAGLTHKHSGRAGHDEPTREISRQSSDHDNLRLTGERLFRTVFVDKIAEAFRASVERTRPDNSGLRICLRLDNAPELVSLPWEALWDPESRTFLADHANLPIVRTLGVSATEPVAAGAKTPLKILALLPEPRGEGKLSGVAEWQKIREHLNSLIERGELEAHRLEAPTLNALGKQIDKGPCHVLHVVAHGGPGDVKAGGLLKLEDDVGNTDLVSGVDLARALERHAAPRLVVLSACYGARAAIDDAFDGMAQHLLSRGVPAVVAMRTAISDAAAVDFATALYRELASGRSVEGAMVNARRALSLGQHRTEWATPVVYLRGENVRILGTTTPGLSEAGRDHKMRFARSLPSAAALALIGAIGVVMWRAQVSEEPTLAESRPPKEATPLLVEPDRCPPPLGLKDLTFVEVEPGVVDLGERQVIVDKAFCIGTKEVSRRDWATVMGPELLRREGMPEWPMTDVNPEDAVTFLRALEAQKSGIVYRLPTVAEWEFAARAGETTQYFFGDDPADLDRFGNCRNHLGSDCADGPAPVGRYSPNKWGLHDVHGNVAEWVQWPEEAGSPLDDNGQERSLRLGGSFDNVPSNCTFARPKPVRADVKRPDTGFRVVREIAPSEQ